jgi:predicted dehydrogenase
MGNSDLRDMLKAGAQLVALCDVDDRQVTKTAASMAKQFDQKPEFTTRDFRKVLDRKDIDAVIVATPDHWHALPTVMACQAGKDVYVEKPLALTIGEGRVMVDAARTYGRVVQMGTQQRSAQHFTDAVEYVKSGALGKIRLVKTWAYQDWMGNIPVKPDVAAPAEVDYDMWLGPAKQRPFNENRFHFNFRWYYDYSGGLMTDWGAHMIDIANWGMNVKAPKAAVSVGGKFGFPDDAEETPDTQQALWECDGFSMIWEHATAIGQGPYMRDHGVAFRMAGEPRKGTGGEDSHLKHVQDFLDCMDTRKAPRSDVEVGHNSMIACHLGNIAFRLNRRVQWDVDGERFVGDEDAQKLVMPAYRAPWALPKVTRPTSSAAVR